MRYSVLSLLLLIFINQYAESTVIGNEIKYKYVYDNARGIQDIWQNVQASIKAVWDAVKNIAHNTKEKIEEWKENLKQRAEELSREFEKRLEDMKKHVKEILHKIEESGELMKTCVKQQNEGLEALLQEILDKTLQCVKENINKLSTIENRQFFFKNDIDETDFINQVEKQLEACAADEENAFKCFYAVRKEALKNTADLEGLILSTRVETRNAIDDILDSIATCTTKGIIESSSAVAEQVTQIIDCVKNGSNV